LTVEKWTDIWHNGEGGAFGYENDSGIFKRSRYVRPWRIIWWSILPAVVDENYIRYSRKRNEDTKKVTAGKDKESYNGKFF
jgi:hypothetical protein